MALAFTLSEMEDTGVFWAEKLHDLTFYRAFSACSIEKNMDASRERSKQSSSEVSTLIHGGDDGDCEPEHSQILDIFWKQRLQELLIHVCGGQNKKQSKLTLRFPPEQMEELSCV